MKADSLGIYLGENENQSFVQNLDDSIEIAKTIIAFTNTKGGKLIVGLKPNGKIIGIFPSDEINKLDRIIDVCDPNLKVNSQIVEIGFRLLLVVNIEKSDIHPLYFTNESGKKEVYVRCNKLNILANKILLNVWKFKEKNGDLPEILSDNEIQIVDIIKLNPNLSLTQIYKKANLTIDEVDYILVRLINWKIVETKITETGSFFVYRFNVINIF